MLPGPDDVAFYREHGWWISPEGFVPDGLLDAAARGQERLYADDLDHRIPERDGLGWQPSHGDDILRKNDFASRLVDELDALVRHPAIGAAAARLAGTGEIRLWHDQLLYKPPETVSRFGAGKAAASAPGHAPSSLRADGSGAVVGWHTDRQYWGTCSSETMLTAWVPFHDVGEEIGTLELVDGSHRWSGDAQGLDFFGSDLATQEAGLGRPVSKVAARMKKGQVSFHDCRTIHGSGPNRSGEPRRALAIHLQTGDNRWTGEQGHDLVGLTGGDFADPFWCPRLHP